MDGELATQRNKALQAEWYGEPLGDRFRRLLDRLTLSQAQLAEVLGLSAPMVSQLMSGVRAKISNPAVLARLAVVEERAADPAFLMLPPAARTAELRRLADEAPASTGTLRSAAAPTEPLPLAGAADPVAAVQGLLRAVASAAELDAAARLLDPEHPALAEVLRTYGTLRTADARAHYDRTVRSTG